MRTNVTFCYPAEFVRVSDEDGILSVAGAGWFVSLLERVSGASIESELCQEDWGVVAFAERAGKRFWIGLSGWGPREDDSAWLAHFHHHSFAWLQRWTTAGQRELERLTIDFHSVLASEPRVTDIAWYPEGEMKKAHPHGFSAPNAASPRTGISEHG
ncbi:hypothetical protein CfE428DRAFT_3958 [Chthoniobacter flavus Ellin428]|uniref:Uncharacterized protein n=1 Tax=Chthoniobacter flavus Ellin428 TaxID=497964 RepID=B4D4X0_9BACT|nr:hypothetical protein CfE428DRAFT_3958 [Chthoniobacter flavus Ellin428]TCO90972.1 hypothetical protein EV701_109122 [Chthoniobacter flavus]